MTLQVKIQRGYKRVEIGEIPEDWEVASLRSCARKITDGEHLTPKRATQGHFLLSARNVLNGVIDVSDVDYVGMDEYTRLRKRCDPDEGDVLLSCSGTIGRVAVVPSGLKCVLVRSAALVKPDRSRLDPLFLHYWLRGDIAQKQISISVNQGAQPNLFLSQIEKLNCVVPPLPEQRAIAAALSDADALIASLDALIAKKRDLKQAAMQQLLTGKTRLPGFSGEWEVKRLGDIGEAIIGLTYKPSDVASDGLLVLRSSNVQEGRLRFEDNVFVKIEVPDRIRVKRGDILICVRNGSRDLIGKCARITHEAEGMTFGAFMAVFRTAAHNFIHQQFQSDIVKRQIHEHLGATINQITNKSLNSFEVPLPLDKKEQDAIAATLSDMDAELAALEAKRDKARVLKQGMMQELLTGRIRLI